MANDSWRTPPEIFNHYNKRFDFALDVAASDDNHLCRNYITKEQDALTTSWNEAASDYIFGRYVWCNPPYSNPLPFVSRAIYYSRQGVGSVFLLNHDMSVEWSKMLVRYASELHVFIASGSKEDKTYRNGRIAFLGDDGQPIHGNTKGQVVAIIPPFSHGISHPVTHYMTLPK